MGIRKRAPDSQLTALVGREPAEAEDCLRRSDRIERLSRPVIVAAREIGRAIERELLERPESRVPGRLESFYARVLDVLRLEQYETARRIEADIDLRLDKVLVVGSKRRDPRRGTRSMPAQADVDAVR